MLARTARQLLPRIRNSGGANTRCSFHHTDSMRNAGSHVKRCRNSMAHEIRPTENRLCLSALNKTIGSIKRFGINSEWNSFTLL